MTTDGRAYSGTAAIPSLLTSRKPEQQYPDVLEKMPENKNSRTEQLRDDISKTSVETRDVEAANPSTASASASAFTTTASGSTNNRRKKRPLTFAE